MSVSSDFVARAQDAAQQLLQGLTGLPPCPEVLMALSEVRAALQALQNAPERLCWSHRQILLQVVARVDEAQRLMAPPPPALQA
ncbi:hypothetical protein [Deinococcus multiflagellatus]|uniref:Uncharacterized protein n=1 Tax=Deinococcus multiflagellatus TaxID=1656887 RepID=A0ABW1ZNN6_9DEIO|nr:hypothetical protein [Deinococcus multiflagellatus]MBZ9714901.1 hypothetical protein [Deinococcus multiflagellatus]